MVERPGRAVELYLSNKNTRTAAYASEWDVAIYAFEQALAIVPDDNVCALSLAIAYLQTGQEEEYARVSHTLLSLAKEVPSYYVTERAAKAALLGPVSGPDFDDACRLADSLVEPPYPASGPWGMQAKSLAEYRRGNFASAIEWAGQVHIVGRDECIAAADFIMSACHASLGDTSSAQQSFSEGSKVMELPRSIKYCVDMFWRDWVMAERFRDEAKALMERDVRKNELSALDLFPPAPSRQSTPKPAAAPLFFLIQPFLCSLPLAGLNTSSRHYYILI